MFTKLKKDLGAAVKDERAGTKSYLHAARSAAQKGHVGAARLFASTANQEINHFNKFKRAKRNTEAVEKALS